MKHYLVEPTYKKSVIEFTIFKRKNEEGKDIFLRKELGWRWGSWLFSVPETEDEALAYLKSKGFEGEDGILHWAEDYGYTITDDNGNEILDPDTTLIELLQNQLLPSESEEFVDITEDYEDAEMLEAFDGCWEFWDVYSHQVELDEDDQEAIMEEASEAYNEEYEEGVEALGWEYVDTYFELQCNPKITPCHSDGTLIEGEAEDA